MSFSSWAKALCSNWKKHTTFGFLLLSFASWGFWTQGQRNPIKAESLTLNDLQKQLMQSPEWKGQHLQRTWRILYHTLKPSGWSSSLQLSSKIPTQVTFQGSTQDLLWLKASLSKWGIQAQDHGAWGAVKVQVSRSQNHEMTLNFEWHYPKLHSEGKISKQHLDGPWWSLWPPLLAVLIALFYRRVLWALGFGVWIGALLLMKGNPVEATFHLLSTYVFTAFQSPFKRHVLLFTLFLIGMIQLTERMHGNRALAALFGRKTRTPKGAKLATVGMGMAVFFDDYANSLIVGTSAQPMIDRFKISRAKLAYLVDATAAPIAGLALVSTWVGYEVGLFTSIAKDLSFPNLNGLDIFVQILPWRFYCIFSIFFVLINSLVERDYGPMLKAEQEAMTRSLPLDLKDREEQSAPLPWWNALIPIGITLLSAIIGLILDGWLKTGLSPWTLEGLRQNISAADNSKVLFYAAALGSLTALFMGGVQGYFTLWQGIKVWMQALKVIALPLGILILAWAIQQVTKDLGTSYYLISTLESSIPPLFLPLMVFVLAAAVAFATGTSWGTMGILLPAAIPMVWSLSNHNLFLTTLAMGAVLDGSIFGDHCSPISDTTIMSSMASGCDHVQHVKTQLPYALTVMMLAALLGYVALPMGLSLWLILLLAITSMLAIFYLFASPIRPQSANEVKRPPV